MILDAAAAGVAVEEVDDEEDIVFFRIRFSATTCGKTSGFVGSCSPSISRISLSLLANVFVAKICRSCFHPTIAPDDVVEDEGGFAVSPSIGSWSNTMGQRRNSTRSNNKRRRVSSPSLSRMGSGWGYPQAGSRCCRREDVEPAVPRVMEWRTECSCGYLESRSCAV